MAKTGLTEEQYAVIVMKEGKQHVVGKLVVRSNIDDWRCSNCGKGWFGCKCSPKRKESK